jgi:hypothetical protein
MKNRKLYRLNIILKKQEYENFLYFIFFCAFPFSTISAQDFFMPVSDEVLEEKASQELDLTLPLPTWESIPVNAAPRFPLLTWQQFQKYIEVKKTFLERCFARVSQGLDCIRTIDLPMEEIAQKLKNNPDENLKIAYSSLEKKRLKMLDILSDILSRLNVFSKKIDSEESQKKDIALLAKNVNAKIQRADYSDNQALKEEVAKESRLLVQKTNTLDFFGNYDFTSSKL